LRESQLSGIFTRGSGVRHRKNSLITSVDVALTISTSSNSGSRREDNISHSHKDRFFHVSGSFFGSASQVIRSSQSERIIAQREEDVISHVAEQTSKNICGGVDCECRFGTSTSQGIHSLLSVRNCYSRRISVLCVGVVGGAIRKLREHPSVVGTNNIFNIVGAASILRESQLSGILANRSGIRHHKNSLITSVDVALTISTRSDSGSRNGALRITNKNEN